MADAHLSACCGELHGSSMNTAENSIINTGTQQQAPADNTPLWVFHGNVKNIKQHGHLQVPCLKTNFGNRAFAVTGPASWNRLPATIRSSDTLQNFKTQLKAHFF